MPCSCDGYVHQETSPTKKDVEQLCCQAQSLAHKLGVLLERNGISIPEKVYGMLKFHRSLLLDHKKKELKEDLIKAKRDVDYAENKIKKICGLGGIPTQETIKELEDNKLKLDAVTRTTDEDLLGEN